MVSMPTHSLRTGTTHTITVPPIFPGRSAGEAVTGGRITITGTVGIRPSTTRGMWGGITRTIRGAAIGDGQVLPVRIPRGAKAFGLGLAVAVP